MPRGYLCLVLHAHLPFVRHPEHENFLEEKWLYEAITETYIPLIQVFERLIEDNVKFRVTLTLSPTLISMFTDPLLQERYVRHLEKLIELADKEEGRTYGGPFHETALMYKKRFHEAMFTFCDRYNRNLVTAFKNFQDQGRIEIITCAATHGYLPFMMIYPEAIRGQIKTAVDLHTRHLGRPPAGVWLPECAFAPGLDEILKECGLKFFFTDSHGVLYASHRPRFGIFAPIYCPSGVAAFGRDIESSKQVWSTQEGYPGDFDYREFYRDIGFDLGLDYIGPYIHPDGIRVHTGIKYYKITGKVDLSQKQPYNPRQADEKAALHAGNFMFNRQHQIYHLSNLMDRPPIIVAPYDAELFGHWWFEGPKWLDYLIRKTAFDQDVVEMATPSDYLRNFPCNQVATPCSSSWGNKGYHEVWLCGSNDWIYRHLHMASEMMISLASQHSNAGGLYRRALNQAARELLLAQSSDWAFIMSTGTMVEYAVKRTKNHLLNFFRLQKEIKGNCIDEGYLGNLEYRNNIFPDLDYSWYTNTNELPKAASL
ncbi:1,4-alpha-glucan branching protein domain-containing protein [Pelotomaculum sp. PtaB.Bin117]|uniref:glycoside hydrolase family 57 protein n=1 Tax=Pelotomaculum sp. PtaB.Bin117 TaxID=1811694 RepID=UPI0009CFD869|nr:1,4-alpha-glucan branching protein domain-containing protein [Pelotomaculum sp. PtaB.Bin117]OPX85080.1 MAG: 1,4-alpha-glucan branching enzyme [Pelotomaculum sp. PtaB.Bin117]